MLLTFSPLTIKAVANAVSGGGAYEAAEPVGIYRSGPKIERLLLDCNLDLRIGSSSRVPALLDFLRSLAAEPDGHQSIARVILRVADPRDYLSCPEKGQAVVDHLNRCLAADGVELIVNDGRPRLRPQGSSSAVVDLFAAKAATLDFDTVRREIDRALESAEKDPEDAVTAACSLIEAVCRSILVELGLELPAKKDIDGLIRAVQEPLALSPGRSDLPSLIAHDVRQILSGLTTTAQGVGALRTHAGDAHGRERKYVRIDPRIARLAIHAASTVALFLIETWERKFRKALPQTVEGEASE
jgi:hypothetical protein